MPILSQILDDVFKKLSRLETVYRSPTDYDLPKKNFAEIWKIETEVQTSIFQKEIELYVAFDEFFPLSIPRIYLSQKSFDEVKYIPHVDKERHICTFHSDTLILDTENPFAIVQICLKKAKKIIEDGLAGTNHEEFKDELGAYWTDNNEFEIIQYLSLGSDFKKESKYIKIGELCPTYKHIKYILYNDEMDSTKKMFMDFLSKKGHKWVERNALLLGNYEIGSCPPFPVDNEDVLKTINSLSIDLYKNYINSKQLEKYIFFLADTSTKPILLGWKHKALNTQRNGYRLGILTPFDVLSKFQKKDKIERIIVNEYSNNLIENRTSGIVGQKYNFLIAGLGSIGSNLVYFLNGMNFPNYKLIDDDFLKLENIGRHLMGIDNIHTYKTDALKLYIKNIRPDQDVIVKQSKLEFILTKNIDFFNDCTYAFIAIGNQNVEHLLLKMQNGGQITVPMFILWVEPYAIGGHCVFLHPDNKVIIEQLYEKNLYRFNVIASREYFDINPMLSKQIAGCQTSFTPYSGNHIIMFLSSIYKWINDIIQNDVKQSMAMHWVGDKNLAKELGLSISELFDRREAYSNKVIYLNDDN